MMRYRTWVSLFLALFAVLTLLVVPALAQEADKEDVDRQAAPANPKQASVNLLIEGSSDLANIIPGLCHVADMEKIAGKAGYSGNISSIMFVREGRFVVRLSVEQIRQDAEEHPELVLKTLSNHLRQIVSVITGPRPDEIKRREAALHLAKRSEREVLGLRGHLMSLKRNLMRRGGGISPEGLEHQCRELQSQKMMLDVELAGLRARREAIIKHIAPRERKPATGQDDPRLKLEELKRKKLEAQLAFHTRELERLQSSNERIPGTVTRTEIEHARLKVTELEVDLEWQREVIRSHMAHVEPELPIELEQRDHALRELKKTMAELMSAKALQAQRMKPGAKDSFLKQLAEQIALVQGQIDARRQELRQFVRSESLAARNDQLVEVEIETATVEAKLEAIERMLGRLNPEELQQLAAEMEESRSRLEQALDQRAAARKELARLERQQAELRPSKITVLDNLITEDKNEKKMDEPCEEK